MKAFDSFVKSLFHLGLIRCNFASVNNGGYRFLSIFYLLVWMCNEGDELKRIKYFGILSFYYIV